jgi:hypothetical protein
LTKKTTAKRAKTKKGKKKIKKGFTKKGRDDNISEHSARGVRESTLKTE